jgi:hypothetical protein
MPEPGSSPRGRIQRSLEWICIALALLLALRPPLLVAAGKTQLNQNDISGTEQTFALWARAIPPDARVGWLLPEDPAPPAIQKMVLISQYALVPRRLDVVSVARCQELGRQACGIEELDFAMVPDFSEASFSARDDAFRLGLLRYPTLGEIQFTGFGALAFFGRRRR